MLRSRRIGARLTSETESGGVGETTYYDTFDWSVYADGGMLAHRAGILNWIPREGGTGCSQSLACEPGFVGDMAKGPVRNRIPSCAKAARSCVI